jgi:hypothetical protein
MLFVNYTSKTFIFYDKLGEKHVVYPNGKIDDSICPEVFNMDSFIPYGIKRTPKKIKET